MIRYLGFEEKRTPYQAETQRARFWTEMWAEKNLYCLACGAANLTRNNPNTPASDFVCAYCSEEYELKSARGPLRSKVVDGAYDSLVRRLVSATNPSLALLRYDRQAMSVRDLIVVPKFFFTPGVVEPRKPLAETARRAGWVGCNILLSRIPSLGMISVVKDGKITDREAVLSAWRQTRFLNNFSAVSRGWLLDVLLCVLDLDHGEFTLSELYGHEARLSTLYPGNSNVRAKIRQQLQVLRDGGIIEFLGRGRYKLANMLTP